MLQTNDRRQGEPSISSTSNSSSNTGSNSSSINPGTKSSPVPSTRALVNSAEEYRATTSTVEDAVGAAAAAAAAPPGATAAAEQQEQRQQQQQQEQHNGEGGEGSTEKEEEGRQLPGNFTATSADTGNSEDCSFAAECRRWEEEARKRSPHGLLSLSSASPKETGGPLVGGPTQGAPLGAPPPRGPPQSPRASIIPPSLDVSGDFLLNIIDI
ncbi:hypothetical protein ACSSS7_004401 [Eimeria intestinalis]